MLPLSVGLALALQTNSHYPDRAKFLHTLAHLADRAPMADVLKALGRPDRTEHEDFLENGKPAFSETWFYGTDGPAGAATLAQFVIYNGNLAYHPVSTDPPPTSVISEVDLRKGMHIILDSMAKNRGAKTDVVAAWVVKTVNALLPFGETKCKAILGECGRLMEGYAELDPRPFFLCYSLFDPPQKPGYFDGYGPIWYSTPPKDHLAHPRWPVEIVDNVPIIRGEPLGGFGGYAPPFVAEFNRIRDRIHLRKSPLTAPK